MNLNGTYMNPEEAQRRNYGLANYAETFRSCGLINELPMASATGIIKKLMADEKKLFKVTIDNITIEVEPGTTVLNAARKIGGDVILLLCAITAN